ncbi:MAG: ATP-dependent 6-phosphofructokinase, partial [Thermodesulfobacteriota bacterium]|nr:ATP-dependent 6-phosphofructokinase [Thermodesulfobacteriota bacterium]
MNYDTLDTKISILGRAAIQTPLQGQNKFYNDKNFISDNTRVVIDVNVNSLVKAVKKGKELPSFELAGPRKKIYFDPSKLRCALVACGGLCPGLNGIIRAVA